MAGASLKVCSHQGCRTLTRSGRCEKHGKRDRSNEQYRGTAASRGYDYAWQKARDSYIRENPLCIYHLLRDEIRAAECVDHIIPHRGSRELFWDYDNWCSLCGDCHGWKSWQERDIQRWEPRETHIVLCGLPAAGKTTAATQLQADLRCAVFDMDEEAKQLGITGREQWSERVIAHLKAIRGRFVVEAAKKESSICIVSHPLAALRVASAMQGTVRHVRCSEAERQDRLERRRCGGLTPC